MKNEKLTPSQIRNQWKTLLWQNEMHLYAKGISSFIESKLDHKTLTCCLTYESITHHCQINVKTMIRYMKVAIDHGFIYKQRRYNQSNIYSIVPIQEKPIDKQISNIELIHPSRGPINNLIDPSRGPMIGPREGLLRLTSTTIDLNPYITSYFSKIFTDRQANEKTKRNIDRLKLDIATADRIRKDPVNRDLSDYKQDVEVHLEIDLRF